MNVALMFTKIVFIYISCIKTAQKLILFLVVG